MTQEEKDLLLKDLCARLPYTVMVECSIDSLESNLSMDVVLQASHITELIEGSIVIKPYLRPMSSMTEEEFRYFMGLRGRNLSYYDIQQMMKKEFSIPNHITIVAYLGKYLQNINWLLSNHFDVYGLIEKGLALEAPEGMYKN